MQDQKRRSKVTLPKIDKTDAAYMAGIMDGEGHFSIARSGYGTPWVRTYKYQTKEGLKTSKCQGSPTTNYTVRIGCANTNKKLINWIQEHIGGTFSIHRQNGGWKECYKWHLYGATIQEQFILALLPYMILKREQANIVLQFIRLHGVDNPSKREELYQQIRLLNRRGTCPTTNTPNTLEQSKELKRENFLKAGPVKIESELAGDCKSVP